MKYTLLSILMLVAVASFAQKQEQPKPQYKKVIVLEVQDFNTLTESLNQWKRLLIYDTQAPAADKVKMFQNIESYQALLTQRVKMDSVRIDSVVVQKPKK